ncbi:MAG: hypothetical protein Q8M66_07105 [Actinomycetota bacterium]|nr:hypothetical protein [Actinomycetota bacterium]MDZ4179561.1 hypothetical protein [Coriobacteriia bacterium]
MSDSTQSQKQIMILLVVVAVLAAAIVGVLVFQRVGSSTTVDAGANQTAAEAPADAAMPPASAQVPATEFDPAAAPAVPADQTPEQYVTNYYELCSKGEYDTAFVMLPVATQQYYGDAAGFGNTLKGYGITAFEVSPQVESGDEITVVGAQEAQGMAFPYTWVFAKGDDGSWLVKARQMGVAQ